jgi:hypothetical protein
MKKPSLSSCCKLTNTHICLKQEAALKQSDHFRESAESCARLAERATEDAM